MRAQRISFVGGGAKDIYASNIQVADLNALNAVLAVIKWKKIRGFYRDLEREHHCTYTTDGNMLINGDLGVIRHKRTRASFRRAHPRAPRARHSLCLDGICDIGAQLLLRMRRGGRRALHADGLEDDLRRRDHLAAPVDRQLDAEVPVALCDRPRQGDRSRPLERRAGRSRASSGSRRQSALLRAITKGRTFGSARSAQGGTGLLAPARLGPDIWQIVTTSHGHAPSGLSDVGVA